MLWAGSEMRKEGETFIGFLLRNADLDAESLVAKDLPEEKDSFLGKVKNRLKGLFGKQG